MIVFHRDGFQSTPPVKAATAKMALANANAEFQSTPPVKAATSLPSGATEKKRISIHAAREGGDGAVLIVPPCAAISIHAAREGGDARAQDSRRASGAFQSTPPVKAATLDGFLHLRGAAFQSTPPVKAATRLPVF